MQALPPALLPLGAWQQFVTWVAAADPLKPGKLQKFPTFWATGDVVDAHNPGVWTNALTALSMAPGQNRGVGSGAGFVLTDQDPFFFLDIDGAWDAHLQAWSPVAQDICARLHGAAIEVSMSGTGLHIIGRCSKPLAHAKKNTPKALELYTSKRFVALTGLNAVGDASLDCTSALAGIVADYFPPTATGDWAGWTTAAVVEYTGPANDDELIRKALASGQRTAAAAFGGTADVTFADLWNANAEVLGRKWPPNKHGEGYDASSADMALANMLAFWTGKNCERMRTLMELSSLNRSKWHARPAYLADTVVKACQFVQSVYTAKAAPDPVAPPPSTETMLAAAQTTGRQLRDAGAEYMGPHIQLEHFAGCFFDNFTGKVYSFPKNTEFSKASFDVNYGGHVFVMDPNGHKTSTSAWEAFTQSRVNVPPIVDALCFRPELPGGIIVDDGKRRYVNSYVPHEPVVREGDPSKMLDHMARLLPDPEDRKKLVSYLAAMAQNPGRKFQWWPVVQGAEGNGKSLIGVMMTYAMGQEYTHAPNSHAMARDGLKFNGWIYRKLLIVVEEIMLSHKRDFLDEIKPLVTNERIPVERKGQEQINFDNRANGILFTNHKDGVPITVDTRRWAIFYCAQQHAEDLARDGMTEHYFADLVDWIKGRGEYSHLGADYGASVFLHYLRTMTIEDAYNPARLSLRAPVTTSTSEARLASMGRAEQEIMDAIEEGRPGFAGGWVSSKYLDDLLEKIRANVPRNKRRDLMATLGYGYHPVLRDGRVNDYVMPDNAKPRLYLRDGHLAFNLDSPVEIAKAYSKAQEISTAPTRAEVVFMPPKG